MLKLELTDQFGGPDKWVIVSDAKTVAEQENELEPLKILGMTRTANIRLIHLHRGRRAIQFFPQSREIKEAMERLCTHLNEEQEANNQHIRAERL